MHLLNMYQTWIARGTSFFTGVLVNITCPHVHLWPFGTYSINQSNKDLTVTSYQIPISIIVTVTIL